MRFHRSTVTRQTAVRYEDIPAFFAEVYGTPLPGWTGLIGPAIPEGGPPPPPPDWSMRCVGARVTSKRTDDGRIVVDLIYEEVPE